MKNPTGSKQPSPVAEEMRANGIGCESVYDFVNGETPAAAVPILIDLLEAVTDPLELEGIIRSLATEAASGQAERPLIKLFQSDRFTREPASLIKWAIGNTLNVLNCDGLGSELLAIAADRQHGMARQMIVLKLGALAEPDPVPTLITLLDDEAVSGQAATALGRRKASAAIAALRAFAAREKGWKLSAALTAITRIQKSGRT
jgi:HEAT repeat protein